jgi:hypothetical protein
MVPVSISLGCNFDHLPLIQCLMYFMETHGKLLQWPHRTQNLEIVWESHKQAIRHGSQGSDHDYRSSLKRESSKGKNILQYLRLRLYPNMNPSTLLHPLTAQACKLMQRNPQWPSWSLIMTKQPLDLSQMLAKLNSNIEVELPVSTLHTLLENAHVEILIILVCRTPFKCSLITSNSVWIHPSHSHIPARARTPCVCVCLSLSM